MVQNRFYDLGTNEGRTSIEHWQTWLIWVFAVIAYSAWTYLHIRLAGPLPNNWTPFALHVGYMAVGGLFCKAWIDVRLARHGR